MLRQTAGAPRLHVYAARRHHGSVLAHECGEFSVVAEPGDVHRVLLLYSGGLDTSVMLKWIQDEYEAEVVALTIKGADGVSTGARRCSMHF